MSTGDDRSEMQAARSAGLKARHEQRLENATYTAAEVKVLTADACKFAYALGRKEALDELKAWLYSHQHSGRTGLARWSAYLTVAGEITRMLASPDATSGRTDPKEGA